MPISILVPDVEHRINAWVQIVERKKKEDAKKKTGITITISREFGCEGYPLAEKLKNILEKETSEEWIILDRELIEKVSKDTHLSKTLIKDLGIESSSIRDLFSSFGEGVISKDQVFREIAEVILQVAKEGNAIIVGRGAAIITSHLDNCFHFRLEAPLDYRIDLISKRADIDRDEAKKIVNEGQKVREKFLNSFLKSDLRDPKLYDGIYNNSKSDVDSIAQSIFTYIKAKF